MRYFILLMLILGLTACAKEAKEMADSLNIVEQNLKLINRGTKAKKDIQAIRNTLEQKNRAILEQLGEAGNIKEYEKATPSDQSASPVGESPVTSGDLVIPESFNLPVKFASQAPFEIWDELHKEVCEEAAMIVAVKYLKGEKLDKEIMEEEILKLVKWEEKNDYKIDLTVFESVEILKNYFNLDAQVARQVTVERIKQELALGNLVITPHAGRELGNPYYRQPGPSYHFLVIRGWDEDEFITNDVGTKRGEGYKYKYDVILKTMHDWNEGDVSSGEMVMIVVSK